VKTDARMKNFRPILIVGIWSPSIIRRKCLIEKPARDAAVGMSRNIRLLDSLLVLISSKMIRPSTSHVEASLMP